MRNIKECFEDPELFLDLNSRIVIGKSPFETKTENKFELPIPSRTCTSAFPKQVNKNILGRNTLKENIKNNKIRANTAMINKKEIKDEKRLNSQRDRKSNYLYEYKNNDDILKIFEEYKEMQNKLDSNKNAIEEYIPYYANNQEKRKFAKQDKLLKDYEKENLQINKFSKKLAKKLNKNESDLIMNKGVEYKLKSQVMDCITKNAPLPERFGNYYWRFTLRRQQDLDQVRRNPVNLVKREGREVWQDFLELKEKPVEIIQYPNNPLIKNKYPKIIENQYFKEKLEKMEYILPNMDEISKLKLKGKDCCKEEEKLFNKQFPNKTNKIRLYNFNQEDKEKDLTLKRQYDRPNSHLCKCKNKSRIGSAISHIYTKKQSELVYI
ncbi:MAG: hypothetical protein MJ252_05940, partial [archaeon]|nr:hypothetical protein [archaeon]